MKIYRNIYFLKNIFLKGNGQTDLLYYGNLYGNTKYIKDFNKIFDKKLDLLINCSDCAKNKYKSFIKVKRN